MAEYFLILKNSLNTSLKLIIKVSAGVSLSLFHASGHCEQMAQPLQNLPEPEHYSAEYFQKMNLKLELVINQVETGVIVDVKRNGRSYFVASDDLVAAGILEQALPDSVGMKSELLDVSNWPGASVNYLQLTQQLAINVPAHWLPVQNLSAHDANRFRPAQYGRGGLLNYSVFGLSGNETHQTNFSLNHDLRAFSELGVLTTTGLYQFVVNHNSTELSDSQYTRFETRYEYADQGRLLRLEAGDFIVRPLSWTQPVRMAGVQLSHDFSMRPDVVTAPLPAFYGETTVPTTLDLFVNGQKTDSIMVGAGPYVINNIPMISGAGEATVIVTDAQGRQTAITTPFFLSPQLLKPGYASYNISLGVLRENYGNDSNDYGDGALTAALRFGLTERLTVETQTEITDNLMVSGAGVVMNVFDLGTVDASVRVSNAHDRAYAHSIGYSYQSRRYSFGIRTQLEEASFSTLASTVLPAGNSKPDSFPDEPKRVTQVNAGVRLGEWGSVSCGYFDIQQPDARSRTLNITYSYPLPFNINMSLSFNRDIGGESVSFAQFTLPLGTENGSAGLTVRREEKGNVNGRLGYSRLAPLDGGWGISLAHDLNEKPDNRKQADLTYRASWAQFRTGLSGVSGEYDKYAEFTGAIALMDGALFPANQVSDSFVVISTDGFSDIPVKYENQVVGVTNDNGYLLIPWTTAYYTAKYEIDPLNLPANARITTTEQFASVYAGYGYLMRFPVSLQVSLSMVVVDSHGQYLPLGTYGVSDTGLSSQIGWDGFSYFEGRNPGEFITFYPQDSLPCRVAIQSLYQQSGHEIQILGEQTCVTEHGERLQ